MSEDQKRSWAGLKKPGMAFWATVALVVVLVGYPTSWAVIVSFQKIELLRGPMGDLERTTFFDPLISIHNEGPEPFRSVLRWYIGLFPG